MGLPRAQAESDVYKVVSLCAVRDAQREVLRTQAQERPEEEQEAARRELNRVYDVFVRQYGPINREVRVTDVRGKVSIRRPNLDAFRGDPYAMNVAARQLRYAPLHVRRRRREHGAPGDGPYGPPDDGEGLRTGAKALGTDGRRILVSP